MARCDQGYLCRVCHEEVEFITESELYLRFIIGEVDPELLHTQPECHLGCNPIVAQFIDDARFVPVDPPSELFRKESLDAEYSRNRTELITHGYRRLWEIRTGRAKAPVIPEYPLPGQADRWT